MQISYSGRGEGLIARTRLGRSESVSNLYLHNNASIACLVPIFCAFLLFRFKSYFFVALLR